GTSGSTLFPYRTLFRSMNKRPVLRPGLRTRCCVDRSPPAPPRPRRRPGDHVHPLAHRPQVDHVGLDVREAIVVAADLADVVAGEDRKSTRLNSSHVKTS